MAKGSGFIIGRERFTKISAVEDIKLKKSVTAAIINAPPDLNNRPMLKKHIEEQEKKMPTQKEIWERWTPPDTLEECVQLMFQIFETVETSDAGREFNPTHISSCRVWDTHRLGKLLPKMKELSTYGY